MVLQAVRDGFPARAAAIYGAFTDLEELIADNPERYLPMAKQIWEDWDDNSETITTRRSAVKWVEKLNAPLLIMHGSDDQSIPVDQSLKLASMLSALDKTYQLNVFANDNHLLSHNSFDRDRTATIWFQKHHQENKQENKKVD